MICRDSWGAAENMVASIFPTAGFSTSITVDKEFRIDYTRELILLVRATKNLNWMPAECRSRQLLEESGDGKIQRRFERQ